MELDLTRTVVAFLALVIVGNGALILAPIPMAASTIAMMVLPSTLVFGAICLGIGVAHGQYRATH
jgi:putative effector of murein hydrolase LrgA (UPF0299 family)